MGAGSSPHRFISPPYPPPFHPPLPKPPPSIPLKAFRRDSGSRRRASLVPSHGLLLLDLLDGPHGRVLPRDGPAHADDALLLDDGAVGFGGGALEALDARRKVVDLAGGASPVAGTDVAVACGGVGEGEEESG